MSDTEAYHRLPWKDRFNQPTVNVLRKSLPAEAVETLDNLRKRLLSLDGVEEVMAWYGHCWHWTLTYRTTHAKDPLAVVIPSPDDLQLAVPVDPDFAKSLPLKRMKRAVREGLDLAREPFNTRWASWSLQAPKLIDDLMDLVDLKLRHLARKAG
ncbi:MAG: hypothetical protein JSV91_01980 [Phycisphaerales bacterium]|nr:MAG: hypothetical protein JSV91_01980 [Phycisphaerales bacterium]